MTRKHSALGKDVFLFYFIIDAPKRGLGAKVVPGDFASEKESREETYFGLQSRTEKKTALHTRFRAQQKPDIGI